MSSTNKDAVPAPTGRVQRAKKFLAPSVKYEIFLQLVRGETTINGSSYLRWVEVESTTDEEHA